jgi:hypothetical protein
MGFTLKVFSEERGKDPENNTDLNITGMMEIVISQRPRKPNTHKREPQVGGAIEKSKGEIP